MITLIGTNWYVDFPALKPSMKLLQNWNGGKLGEPYESVRRPKIIKHKIIKLLSP